MEHKFQPGDIAHIHPHKPVTIGAYVLVQKKPRRPWGASPGRYKAIGEAIWEPRCPRAVQSAQDFRAAGR
jgi:hypothetical protein